MVEYLGQTIWNVLCLLGKQVLKALCHDDVIKWKHFPRYWPFVLGIHRSPLNSPHKDQWSGALMLPVICARIDVWPNNREAGELRRNRAHYDVTVMHARICMPTSLVRFDSCKSLCKLWTNVFPIVDVMGVASKNASPNPVCVNKYGNALSPWLFKTTNDFIGCV